MILPSSPLIGTHTWGGLASVRQAVVRALAAIAMLGVVCSHGAIAAELFGPAPTVLDIGKTPLLIEVADLDGDGAADLAVATQQEAVVVLLSDRSGGFDPVAEVSVGGIPAALVIRDLDGDRVVDLAVGLPDESIEVFLGNGSGGFAPAQAIVVGDTYSSLVGGDFDDDGLVDLALIPDESFSVDLLYGDGSGGFLRRQHLPLSVDPLGLAVGDLNGDGADDLAVATGDNSVVSLLGDGAGGLAPSATTAVSASPDLMQVSDLDSDGHQDLIVVSQRATTTSLLGDGSGAFVETEPIELGWTPRAMAVGDLNGDGSPDAVIPTWRFLQTFPPIIDEAIVVLLGDGDGGFVRAPDILAGRTPRSIVGIGEFDGDPALDLVVAFDTHPIFHPYGRPTNITLLSGNGLGGFGQATNVGFLAAGLVVAEDLDGDSVADLVVGPNARVLLGDGQGGFGPPAPLDVGSGIRSIATGDFNGDGRRDLALARNFNAEHVVSILLGDGQGGFELLDEVATGNFPVWVAEGEFDGDGISDLSVADQTDDTVAILLGDGSGGFVHAADVAVGASPRFVGVADFNGDGKADLVTVNADSNSVTVLLGDGAGQFEQSAEVGVGRSPSTGALEDFNGDAVIDLVVASSQGLTILLGDGRGGLVWSEEIAVTLNPNAVVAGDFNGDEGPDLAVLDTFNSVVRLLLGDSAGGFVQTPTALGVQGKTIAVGDLDGDGKSDLAVGTFDSSATSCLPCPVIDFTVSLLFNQLDERADVNGSNRIDGFDVAEIGRRMGAVAPHESYWRSADVDLNGIVDGNDLALVSSRFGELREEASPLRATLEGAPESVLGTVTFSQVPSEADLLTVRLAVNMTDRPVSGANVAIEFTPNDGEAGQVLEWVGFHPGSCVSGGATQVYQISATAPDLVEVAISPVPNTPDTCGEDPLLDLVFRARRVGTTELELTADSTLIGDDQAPVPGLSYPGGTSVRVSTSEDDLPGQRIALAPERLEFGSVPLGDSARRRLRISNFGFSALTVTEVVSTLASIQAFSGGGFEVAPFGFVELPLIFRPEAIGELEGELIVRSNDPARPEIRVPVSGRGAP